MDHGLATLYKGAYVQATGEFLHILKANPQGANRKLVTNFYAHAKACAGYHQQRTNLGITEPTSIDPLCAVASLAVCLRELGLPYDKARMLAAVRHTGEGSNLQDVVDAAPKLGVSAFPVATSDKEKLIALPKPLVAHVEHDHFLAVLAADKSFVKYNCSDCGLWPGGLKQVTWSQWRAMEPDAYAVITRRGSALDRAVGTHLPGAGDAIELASLPGIGDVLFGKDQAIAVAQRAAALIESLTIGFVPFLLPNYGCGIKTIQPRCPTLPGCDCIQLCPMASPGSGQSDDPVAGDPVDLATGEEEFRPPADLHVYNPLGPSLNFGLIYDSLRNDGTWSPGFTTLGFSPGWSNPYNVYVTYVPKIAPGSLGADMLQDDVNCAGQLPPSGGTLYEGLVHLDNGATIHFKWPTGAAAFDSTHTSRTQTVDAGYPIIVTEFYDSSTGKTQAEVTFPNHTQWFTNSNMVSAPTGLGPFAVVQMTDVNGNNLGLNYTSYTISGTATYLLTSISNGTGTLLSTGRQLLYRHVHPCR